MQRERKETPQGDSVTRMAVRQPVSTTELQGRKRATPLRLSMSNDAGGRTAQSVRALATPNSNTGATTPTPASKLPISALTKRVSNLALKDKSSSLKSRPTVNTPVARARMEPLEPSTPANNAAVHPPVTAIRIRKPTIPKPVSTNSRTATISSSPAVRRNMRTSLTSANANLNSGPSVQPTAVQIARSGSKLAKAGFDESAPGKSVRKRTSDISASKGDLPARRSTRLAKTSSSSAESKTSVVNKTLIETQHGSLPSRQSLSYTSPPKFDFLTKDPNHSTPQRPPKTSTQPYEDLKARWRRNNDENGSPGMLLNDSPIARLHGGVISLDDMDDREVELEMLRKELEALREEVESMDVEKVTLVQELERLGKEKEKGEGSLWRAVVELTEMALEEEEADAKAVTANLHWVASLEALAKSP